MALPPVAHLSKERIQRRPVLGGLAVLRDPGPGPQLRAAILAELDQMTRRPRPGTDHSG